MLTDFLPIQLNVGLFLFSKGDEIVDFTAEQAAEITEFALNRYRIGREFIEGLIAEYAGQSMALSQSTLTAQVDHQLGNADVNGRLNQIANEFPAEVTGKGLLQEIIKAAIESPAALLEIVKRFDPKGPVSVCGIPDDFKMGAKAADDNVGWHMADREEWAKIWELTGGGKGILGVVGDTGSTPSHLDIQSTDERAFTLSVIRDEPTGRDGNFHGTHCEGTAFGKNGIGVAPNATAGSIQCLSARGAGLNTWVADAINLALDKAIELKMPVVISLSIGGGGPDAATAAALLRASRLWETHGIPAIVVAAAGNDGYQGRDNVNYPSKNVNCTSVSPYAESGLIATFGSGGPDVNCAAPGVRIVSADYRGGRSESDGSSMATPHVAGIAALNQSFRRDHGFPMLRNSREFNDWIDANATDAGQPGKDVRFGAGILETFQIMLAAKPDDVTMLATGMKPAPFVSAVIAFVMCLLSFGSVQAQDVVKVRTVVTTTERTDVFVGDKKIEDGQTVLVSTAETTEDVPVIDIGGDITVISAIGSDLAVRQFEAIEPGKFAIERPGDYLIFREALPVSEKFTVVAPKPKFDLSRIAPAAKRLADNLNDQPTRLLLAEAYAGTAGGIKDYGSSFTLEQANAVTKANILTVWPNRTQNLFTNWVDGFQLPLQAELLKVGYSDVETYRLALIEVVKGLRDTSPNSSQIDPPSPLPKPVASSQTAFPRFQTLKPASGRQSAPPIIYSVQPANLPRY